MQFLKVTLLVFASVLVGYGQTKPVDADPEMQGKLLYSMPQSAIDAGVEGTVTVAARIDETGKPTNARLVAGPMWPCGSAKPAAAISELSSTLAEAMMKLQFSPAIKRGKPVAKDVDLKVTLKNPKYAPVVAVDSATGKPKATQISGGVINGKAEDLPKPRYPAAARETGARGLVVVQIVINEEGKVIRAGVVQGPPALGDAARDAACDAKFSPTQLQGTPVRITGVLTYNFVP